MAMVFQDPFSSLNPTMTLGEQVAEWIVSGRPSEDLSRMSPERFPAVLPETALLDKCRGRYAHYYDPPPVLPVAY